MNNYKIVIYGAGVYGKRLLREFARCGCLDNVVAWVDKKHNEVRERAKQRPQEAMYEFIDNVKPINVICNLSYDYIVVAIQREDIAKEAIDELSNLWGVPAEKILWGKASKKNIASMLEVAYL